MQVARALAGLALALIAAAPVAAQGSSSLPLTVFALGGTHHPLNVMNQPETVRMASGFEAGGGLEIGFNRILGLRAVALRADNEVKINTRRVGWGITRTFYGGEVQFRIPNETRALPYVLLGGGAVSIDPEQGEPSTKGHVAAGLGVRLSLGEGRFGLLAETRHLLYKQEVQSQTLGWFTRGQHDVTLNLGLSARLL